MSLRKTISASVLALAAMLFVALASTVAAAHAGHGHAPHRMAGAPVAAKDARLAHAVQARAELTAPAPAHKHDEIDASCGDRGCCSNGHCSGCGTAIAPSSWIGLAPAAAGLLLDPDAALLSGLAREGPPRPPKPFV